MAPAKKKAKDSDAEIDNRLVRVWDEVPGTEDVPDGIYLVLHDWKARQDGRYAMVRRMVTKKVSKGREVLKTKDYTMGFFVNAVYAQRLAVCAADLLKENISLLSGINAQNALTEVQDEE